MTKYYANYYSAKREAEKRGLREREYGDMNDRLAYCEWNKSGSRDDEPEVVAFYYFDGEHPEKRASREIKEYIKHELGIVIK